MNTYNSEFYVNPQLFCVLYFDYSAKYM